MAEPKVRFKRDDGSSYPAWEEAKLKDVTEKVDRKAPKGSEAPIMMVSQGNGFIYQSEKYSRENAGQSLKNYTLLRQGEFAYNHGASKAKPYGVAYCLTEESEARVPFVYHTFRFTNGINHYWHEALNTSKMDRKLKRMVSSGARMDGLLNINYDTYMDVDINIPCLEEQQKIADFLTSVDEVIAACEEEVANLEKQKKAVMKKIFSQEVRFKRTDETEFPEWEEKQMGEVINLLSGQDFPPEQYNDEGFGTPYLTGASCILNNKTTAVRWTKTPKNIVKFGDILIVCKGSGSGTVAIVDQQEAHIARQFMCIRPINQLDSKYCYHQVCEMTEDIRSEARGTIPGIDRKTVLQRTISIPCLEEQRLIADFLSDFDEVIAAARRELELWKELKKGLLQQMFI